MRLVAMESCFMTFEQGILTYRFRILLIGNVSYPIYTLGDVLITI